MSLIKSISGIRGTIGGKESQNLTPSDIVKYTSAFVILIKQEYSKEDIKIVVGRDARISGESVSSIVNGTLVSLGVQVVDIGLATTPTVEIAVTESNADAGIILTASHNPKQWNALKLLNNKGEFISSNFGERLLDLAENFSGSINYSDVDTYKKIIFDDSFLEKHINLILKSPFVDSELIKSKNFTVAVDAVNSVGGIAVPALLRALGVKNIIELNCSPDGKFAHNPEPLPENLTDISELVVEKNADIAFVVDPDVDRLAIINEDGTMFGEEYTLVAVADYILAHKKGNTVSNLSSTRALRDISILHGVEYFAAAVGEVNVVEKMKETNAVIGGEGNGGIIFPEMHYGRDALVGIALFLTILAKSEKKVSELRKIYPQYYMSKNKIQLIEGISPDIVLKLIKEKYSSDKSVQISTIDGVKIDFENGWVHLRKSNTEPIVRIYSEAKTLEQANDYAKAIKNDLKNYIV